MVERDLKKRKMKEFHKSCKPCEKMGPALTPEQSKEVLEEMENWLLVDDKKIEKVFSFKSFKEALEFVNKIGEIAEHEGHHPNIYIFSYNKVRIDLYTHSIEGLSENDFILASKVDDIFRK
jgi:4a-hydroxytetrahydrobiopterin dehydratase